MWHTPSQKKLDEIPRLYATEGTAIENVLIYLHFYIYSCDWFVSEFEGTERFYGYVILNQDSVNAEWGYFSFQELKDININSVEICCDPEWIIRPASEVERIQL